MTRFLFGVLVGLIVGILLFSELLEYASGEAG